MQFFVAYPEPALGNRLIKDLRQIRRNYARSWFPIDLLSSVPFDLVGVALESMSGGDSQRAAARCGPCGCCASSRC